MNKDMRKIIELSDHPWIQERCPHEKIRIDARYDPGFLYFVPQHDYKFEPCYYFVKCRIHSIGTIISKEHFIWLPVGFNPENCRLQINNLLIEIFNKAGAGFLPEDLRGMFLRWLGEKCNTGMKNVHLIDELDIILKLMWLRELIEKEV